MRTNQPEYAIHTDVFETVMLLAVMAYLAGAISSALVASRIITVQMPLQYLSLLTTCVTSYWLVPEFGLWGRVDVTRPQQAALHRDPAASGNSCRAPTPSQYQSFAKPSQSSRPTANVAAMAEQYPRYTSHGHV